MKKQGHPSYQEVLFVDTATGDKFVIGSALKPKEKEMYNGKEYPLCKVSISSSSHPFFTGNTQLVDSEGRVDRFMKRYSAKKPVTKESEKPVEANKKKK
ncbi:MAG: type B 50S ribosomal protein L31 [Chlamydiae bacterium]|jgi:large subunit ribosomal protein L31|nr:type B 50S ribosomal protein L31 [Chlamydiota bacterium]